MNESFDEYLGKEFTELRQKVVQELAGEHLASMLESKSSAYQFLESESVNLRNAALSVLTGKFDICDDKGIDRLMAFVSNESDLATRMTAKLTLAQCFAKRGLKLKARNVLIEVISDESVSSETRVISYNYLVRCLENLDAELIASVNEINWKLVEQNKQD